MPAVSQQEQRNVIGGGIGTLEDPYTEDEYNILLNSGTFQGGYVEEHGYIGPDVIVTADGKITKSFQGMSSRYNAVEGVGMSGNFAYKGCYMIENGYMSVGCSLFSRFGNDISASGEIIVYVNGQEVLCQPLSTSSSMIYESESVPLGSTTFNLQQYSGNVEVKIRMGYSRFDSGYSGVNAEEIIYSSYR